MDIKRRIDEANNKVLDTLLEGDLHWVGMERAIDVVPGMKENTIMHGGPPLEWESMTPLTQNGIIGAIFHEGFAGKREEAIKLVEREEIKIVSANDMGVVGVGVGIVSPSMVVNVCRDLKTGHEGYCISFEGRSGLGAWGVYNEEVEKNLQFIRNVLAPSVHEVLQDNGGINIRSIIAQGMQMNDETHSRQVAQGLILVSKIVPLLVKSNLKRDILNQCVDILVNTERWFHPLGMASAMSLLQGVKNKEYSTVVTAIAGNGVEMGMKISSLGDKWFTTTAPKPEGAYLSPEWGPEDALPWMGDSCITEVVGMGGFAAAAAPGVVRLRGGTIADAVQQSKEMKAICVGINHNYPIPLLDFTGPPIGIDIRKVVETGITPVLHGGIISKKGGQIGAGMARMPMELFKEALFAFAEQYGLS